MKKRIRILFAILITFPAGTILLHAAGPYDAVDRKMQQIPDSLLHSTAGIGRYINANFKTEKEKVRAAFIWTASNIEYDVDRLSKLSMHKKEDDHITEPMKSHKGICENYASIFQDICTRVSIKSVVISGIVKQNGVVQNIPHAWCGARIDSVWFLFDPTWAAGYVSGSKFYKKINNAYYMVKPEVLIKTHYPFDPLWQFSSYPIHGNDFISGKDRPAKEKDFFCFQDTLAKYERQTEIQQLYSVLYRMNHNGGDHLLIEERKKYVHDEIDYIRNSRIVDNYNNAVLIFNKGVGLLNSFVNYRNHQFFPPKPDDAIRQMVDTVDIYLTSARSMILDIDDPDPEMEKNIRQLNKLMQDADHNLKEQKAFVDKYIATRKPLRKTLFYK